MVTLEELVVHDVEALVSIVRRRLAQHRYFLRDEADMQDQVVRVLTAETDAIGCAARLYVGREVLSASGRYDLVVRLADGPPLTLVLELKTRCAVAAAHYVGGYRIRFDGADDQARRMR